MSIVDNKIFAQKEKVASNMRKAIRKYSANRRMESDFEICAMLIKKKHNERNRTARSRENQNAKSKIK